MHDASPGGLPLRDTPPIESRPAADPAPPAPLLVLAHELRAPLCAIVGLADLLRDPPAPLPEGEVQALAEDIARAGDRLLRLVETCAAAASGGAPFGDCVFEPVDLAAVVHRARIECGAPDRVALDIEPELPALRADTDRLVQALVNLLANALQHGPQGACVTLGLERLGDTALRILVHDTGPGPDAALRPRLFEPFARGAALRPGLGLGLYLTRCIVEAHGGTIGVETAGAGCTFAITLPIGPDSVRTESF